MKITIYTTTECQFSKQEKEYLASHNLPFEEKNLETNREYLTEMLSISNNFAGTPVTKIEKDDGQIVILKGFTVEDFKKTLGFESAPVVSTPDVPPAPSEQPVSQPAEPVASMPALDSLPPAPVAPEPSVAFSPEPVMTVPPAPAVSTPDVPPAPSMPDISAPMAAAPVQPPDQALNSILNDLQSKLNENAPASTPPSNGDAQS